MQKVLSIVVLMLVASVGANAQDGPTYEPNQNVFKISPFHLLAGTMEVGYERYFNNGKSSLYLSPGITLRNRNWWNGPEETVGAQFTGQFRFYYVPPESSVQVRPANQRVVARIYAAPYYKMRYLQVDYNQNFWNEFTLLDETTQFQDQTLSHEGGLVSGVQFTAWDRFTFDLYFGGGVRYSQFVTDNPFETRIRENNIFQPAYTGVVPKIGFLMGIAF